MDYSILLIALISLIAIWQTCSSTYRVEVPTFHVGSNKLGKNTPYCPCAEVNSTFSRNCGVSPKVSGINITGVGAHFGEFPWQVAIIEKYEEEFVCSGVLVSSRVVLTAAHCVQEIPVSQIKVRVGEWDILSEDKNPFETYGSVDIPVSKKYLNTEARSLSETYNLGILKLIIAVNFDQYPHVSPVCLPQITPGKTNLSDCLVTGWIESDVQALDKEIEAYIGDSISQAIGKWSHPLESTSNPVNNHCEVLDGTLRDPVKCANEYLNGISGLQNDFQEEIEGIYQSSEEDMSGEDEPEGKIFSRILSKAKAMVLSRTECVKALKELNLTLPTSNQLCVAAKDGSSPCLGDIGSPVICRVVEEKKPTLKEGKRNDENILKYAVVGVITQSYNCIDGSDKGLRPLLASSISKSLDQICHVMSSS